MSKSSEIQECSPEFPPRSDETKTLGFRHDFKVQSLHPERLTIEARPTFEGGPPRDFTLGGLLVVRISSR